MEEVIGSVLFPPAIVYNGSTVEPQRDGSLMWKIQGRERFAVPAQLTGRFHFITFDRCVREDEAK